MNQTSCNVKLNVVDGGSSFGFPPFPKLPPSNFTVAGETTMTAEGIWEGSNGLPPYQTEHITTLTTTRPLETFNPDGTPGEVPPFRFFPIRFMDFLRQPDYDDRSNTIMMPSRKTKDILQINLPWSWRRGLMEWLPWLMALVGVVSLTLSLCGVAAERGL